MFESVVLTICPLVIGAFGFIIHKWLQNLETRLNKHEKIFRRLVAEIKNNRTRIKEIQDQFRLSSTCDNRCHAINQAIKRDAYRINVLEDEFSHRFTDILKSLPKDEDR